MTFGAGFTPDYYARQDHFAQTDKYTSELDRLTALMDLRFGMRVLDIGCSTGRAADHLERETDCTVFRLDGPPSWLDNPPDRRAVRGDGQTLPFAEATFDAVYLSHALGHVADPQRVLVEAARVTRPGGSLALVTPNRAFVYALRPLNWLRIIPYTPDPTVVTVFSMRRLLRLVQNAGWDVQVAEYAGSLPDHLRWLRTAAGPGMRERLFVGARRRSAVV